VLAGADVNINSTQLKFAQPNSTQPNSTPLDSTPFNSTPPDPSPAPPTKKHKIRPTAPETAEQKAELDKLVERFHCTSRIENLRCLIKLVYYDHVWREHETAKAFQELDSYCGGDGDTLKKVERERAGKCPFEMVNA